jgi:phosphoenolpyruvate carboxykinase (GTP)
MAPADKLPRIYYVNWFRKNANGKFIWPGYGENSRILKWVFERIDGKATAVKTPIGNLPALDSLDLKDLDISKEDLQAILTVDRDQWIKEAADVKEYYAIYENKFPVELGNELSSLQKALTE